MKPLMATRTSNIGKLAGAIAAQIRQQGASTLTMVGPQASYNAVKAAVLATGYLEDTLDGQSLALIPAKFDIDSAESQATVGLQLDVRTVAGIVPGTQPEIFSAGSTNVGLMAGLMVNRFKEGATVVTVGGMGAHAVSSALKATMIAQRYMKDDLGEDYTLALVPKYNEFEEQSETKVRLLLACSKIPR